MSPVPHLPLYYNILFYFLLPVHTHHVKAKRERKVDFKCHIFKALLNFSSGSVVKNQPANAGNTGDMSSIPRLGRSPGGGNGNPLPNPCLENPMDRGTWRATVHRVAKSQT